MLRIHLHKRSVWFLQCFFRKKFVHFTSLSYVSRYWVWFMCGWKRNAYGINRTDERNVDINRHAFIWLSFLKTLQWVFSVLTKSAWRVLNHIGLIRIIEKEKKNKTCNELFLQSKILTVLSTNTQLIILKVFYIL